MNKILVPVDFSTYSKNALDYACKFIQDQQAEIHVVNVVRPVVINSPNAVAIDNKATEYAHSIAKENMKDLITSVTTNIVSSKVDLIQFTSDILVGDITALIKEYTEQ